MAEIAAEEEGTYTIYAYLYHGGDRIGREVKMVQDQQRELAFQLSANRTGSVYVTLDGRRDGERFHWESPGIPVTVGAELAELVSLFAMTEPYSVIGEKVRCEATIRGLMQSEGLSFEFWNVC